MKSFFLLAGVLCALLTTVTFGQTRSQTKTPESQKSSFDKFYERLKISYFGAITLPTLANIEEGDWEQAAISPQFSDAKNHGEPGEENNDTWPANIWHQLSFNYNFGAKMNFVFNPRFMTPLVNSRNMKAPEDRSFLMIDNFLVGFQGVVYSSADKKFNFWIRPGVRILTSRADRAEHPTAGGQTHQLDFSYEPSYQLTPRIQIGFFGQLRVWVYEDEYTCDNRCRLVTAPYVKYNFTDNTQLQVWYENFLESNDRGTVPAGKRETVFKDVWQNVMVGVAQDVTEKLNVFPFVGAYVDDAFSNESVWFGAQISYSIK